MRRPEHGPRDEPVPRLPRLRPEFDELRARSGSFKAAQDEFNDVDVVGDTVRVPPPPGRVMQPADYRWEEGGTEIEDGDDLRPARGIVTALGISLAIGLGVCIGVVWMKWVVPIFSALPR